MRGWLLYGSLSEGSFFGGPITPLLYLWKGHQLQKLFLDPGLPGFGFRRVGFGVQGILV